MRIPHGGWNLKNQLISMLISPLQEDWHIGLVSSLLSLLLRKGASDAPLQSQHSVLFKLTSHGLHPSLQGIQSFWFA